MSNRRIVLFASLVMLVMVGVSCSEKDNPDTKPELPPVDALVLDLDQFIDNPAAAQSLKSVNTYQNALYSYVTVHAWNILATVPMLIPAAAYAEALKQQPEYIGENSWEWAYSVTFGLDSYSARLVTKRISNENFKAEMYLTRDGVYSDFLWFEGTVRYDRTHAEWTLYESPLNNAILVTIEWNMDWEKETSDLTYTLLKQGLTETGSYITFGIVDDDIFDAYYDITLADKEVSIEWNRETKVGRVKDAITFGDANWHCWNELFQDVDCN